MKIGQDVYLYEDLLYKWLIYLNPLLYGAANELQLLDALIKRVFALDFFFCDRLTGWYSDICMGRGWSGLDPFDPSLFLLGGNASATMLCLFSLFCCLHFRGIYFSSIPTPTMKGIFWDVRKSLNFKWGCFDFEFFILFFSLGSLVGVKLGLVLDYGGMRVWEGLH